MNLKYRINDSYKIRRLKEIARAFHVPISVYVDFKKDMAKYKNKYLGKRCFIVGNGPSLTPEDLDLIKNEYSFAANKIYKIFDKTEWRPTFYCIQDINFAAKMGSEIIEAIESAKHSFFRMKGYNSTKELTKGYDNLTYIPVIPCSINAKEFKFSKNVNMYAHDGATVTYMEIQLAAFLGFKKIYLIGVDHSFPFERERNGKVHEIDKDKAAHFYETSKDNYGEDVSVHRSNCPELVTMGYEAAEKYSKKTNRFRVCNATRGGNLNVFERKNLEDLVDASKPHT